MTLVTTRRSLLAGSMALVCALPLRAVPQQPPPTFKAGIGLIALEVQVVDRDGDPLPDLRASQFEISINGRKHPIASLQFVRVGPPVAPAKPAAGRSAAPAIPLSPSGPPPEPRTVVIGVDQTSFSLFGEPAAREAVRSLIDRLPPEDRVGLVAYPGPVIIAPTPDRQILRDALARITGLRSNVTTNYSISASEAVAMKSGDADTIRRVRDRECLSGLRVDPRCHTMVDMDAGTIAMQLEQQGAQSLSALHRLLNGVESLPGRKTLVIVSAGVPATTRPGGRPDLNAEVATVAREAAAANVNLYVFYMDTHFLSAFSAAAANANRAIYDDINMFGLGLEMIAGRAGGTFFKIETSPERVVDQVVRETSGYYLLGVEPLPNERDGKEHFIRVKVNQRGSTVRYRSSVVIPRTER